MLSLFRKLTVLFCEGEATETSVIAASSETKKLIIREKKANSKRALIVFCLVAIAPKLILKN